VLSLFQVEQSQQLNTTTTTAPGMEMSGNATTTAAPPVLTREELLRIARRNLRGLVRLFNMESRQAIEVSLEMTSNSYL
jgi:hypothetical protein